MKTAIRWLALAALAAALAACSQTARPTIQGYAEGEFVLVAAPFAGTLEKLAVARGQHVDAGAPLFALEHAAEQAALDEAEARLATAEARLANLQTGRRAPEVEAARAESESALAARRLAALQLQQQERLFASGFISRARLDEARANYARDTARLEATQAQIRTARQSVGREAEIAAARAEVDAARHALEQSRWRLDQKRTAAPAAALVHDTLFSQGEWVPAGAPIVSLLPPANIKLRFFVPETIVGSVRPGQPVSVSCDGCPGPIPATISYVSTQAEYTPPVIYSKETRAKLVFLVEARPRPEDAVKLRPGQPVDVELRQ
jgi:HlyD family secretion protein